MSSTQLDTHETGVVRAPLARDVWRRCMDLVVTGLAMLPLTLAGQVRRAVALRHRRVDTTATPVGAGSRAGGNVVLVSVATVLPALVAFVGAVMVLFLAWSGWLYPLRPDTIRYAAHPFSRFPDSETAWGGPLFIGAWFIHAMVAVGMQVMVLAVVRGMTAVHGAISRRLLGA